MAWIRRKGPLGLSFLRAKGVLKGFKERLHQQSLSHRKTAGIKVCSDSVND